FETGKKFAPCIIFIDEIDAVGRYRGAGLGGGHDEREQTLNQLLVEMDGFESNEGVILIAATNRPDVLDPALTRPGRFDRQIVVDRPDVRGREEILKVHTRKIPLGDDVRLDVIAKGTPGLAGAELANIVNEAALLAARRGANEVTMSDFEEAKDKVMMGLERRSIIISEEEKRQTAYHEAGHVLVGKLTPGTDPVHKVTIIPRGRALGLTAYLPLDERHNYTRTYLRNSLVQLLGGRAAEKVVFGEFSTGSGNDIERATEIARRMVCEWGMSDRMGPIAFGRKNEEIFLGKELAVHRDYSERTAQEIDAEVKRMVSDAEKTAERLIKENLDKLKIIAEALLEREILDGEEIDILLQGGKLPSPLPRYPLGGYSPEDQKKRKVSKGASTTSDGQVPYREQKVSGNIKGRTLSSSQKRRQFNRSYGIASSTEPENRRPSPTELAKISSPYKDNEPRENSDADLLSIEKRDGSSPSSELAPQNLTFGEQSQSLRRRKIRRRRYGKPATHHSRGDVPQIEPHSKVKSSSQEISNPSTRREPPEADG
ncbi:MAG: ATP-dependent metallopeptidase FtsH/Yme1/Tma family protein, partial [bacterium]